MRYWDIFTGSFHSADAYRAMRYRTPGAGLGYSFVLVAATSLLLVFLGTVLLNRALFTSQRGNSPVFDETLRGCRPSCRK